MSIYDEDEEVEVDNDEAINLAIKNKKLPRKTIRFHDHAFHLNPKGIMYDNNGDDNVRPGDDDLMAVVLERPKGLFALVNADSNDNPQYYVEDYFEDHVSISFLCLERFGKENEDLLKKLTTGKLQLLAYTQDDYKDLSKADQGKLDRWLASNRKKSCPVEIPAGYTYNGRSLHRSATTLFYDVKGDYTIIMGQDEGTYFGCELPKNVKTIDAAYRALMPKEAANRSDFKRQGEWFAIPNATPPEIGECALEADELIMPRESEDSNKHNLSGEIRVDKNGVIYARDWTMSHDDHASLTADNSVWWSFHVNLAVRSYSQEGVD